MNFDIDPITTEWPLPQSLPLFESESANEAVKPSLWQRMCAWFAAGDEPLFGEFGDE